MPQSLQCPRCNGAVSIADQAAGKRVRCPHCKETFLAPGITSTQSDDDDWLKLDDSPAAAAPKPPSPPSTPPQQPSPAPTPAKPKAKSSSPSLSADEEALLAEFSSELDDFTAEIETPPAPLPNVPLAQPQGVPAAGTPKQRGAAPTEPEFASEYRVNCKICGSMMYAKASQAGMTIKCNDCHSPITIPAPPRVRKNEEVDLEKAPTFGLENSQVRERNDPYRQSADALLEQAARQEVETPTTSYDDTPSVKEWFRNVFGIFKDLGVIAHWGGLSIIASVPVSFAIITDAAILKMGLFPIGFFMSVLVVCCGFAILQAVANDEESITDWPTLDPFAWLGQLFVVLAAAGVVAVPAWAVCQALIGPALISVAITMFAVFAFFPFILLSMLDMNSPFVPFSSEVARSVTKCEEAWGGFYFSSALLFVITFLVFALTSTFGQPVGVVISIFVGVAATFCYFSMIGRLAYAIGQVVNSPPMENDIDRSRPTDTY